MSEIGMTVSSPGNFKVSRSTPLRLRSISLFPQLVQRCNGTRPMACDVRCVFFVALRQWLHGGRHHSTELMCEPDSIADQSSATIFRRPVLKSHQLQCVSFDFGVPGGFNQNSTTFLVQMWSRLPCLDASSAFTSSQRPNVKRTCRLTTANMYKIVEDPAAITPVMPKLEPPLVKAAFGTGNKDLNIFTSSNSAVGS